MHRFWNLSVLSWNRAGDKNEDSDCSDGSLTGMVKETGERSRLNR